MKSALSALVVCAVAGSVGVVSCGASVTDPRVFAWSGDHNRLATRRPERAERPRARGPV